MIPAEHLSAFERTLRAGHYSLLLGAGVSTNSHNILGQPIPGAEQLRTTMCKRYQLDPSTPLNEAAEMIGSVSDKEQLLIKPFTCRTPGETVRQIFQFCWRRIYTLNFDDVVERLHETTVATTGDSRPKQQRLRSFHFNEPSVPEETADELQLVHLHGSVRHPDLPIVLTWGQYGEITRSLNGWMAQLGDYLRSSPFIIAGTRFSEPDLEHYLIGRTKQNTTWGPSIWVEAAPTPITRTRCAHHGLLLVEATFQQFLNWLTDTYPDISAPWEQYALELREVIRGTPLADSVARFGSSFRLVRSFRPSSLTTRAASKFLFGHEPTWEDIRDHLDIDRVSTDEALKNVRDFLENSGKRKRVFLVSAYAGTGKTTALKRLSTQLAADQFVVLYVKPGKRIDVSATVECLSNMASTPVIVADSLFECAREIAEILERLSGPLTVIGAERDYRNGVVKQILRGWDVHDISIPSLSGDEVRRLLASYKRRGLLALRGDEKDIVGRIVHDREPIAVTVCRLLNDYRPLDAIVGSLWNDSDTSSRVLFLCCSIVSHCVSEGLRREIAIGVSVALGGSLDALSSEDGHPLRINTRYLSSTRDDFVSPASSAISERILDQRKAARDVESFFEAFVTLAKAIAPYVTKESIQRRTPEARLAARLFDVDLLLHDCLGNNVDKFFREVQTHWEWNSQFWAQRALAIKTKDIRLAVQYARNAVRIQPDHPSPLNTLGALLFEAGRRSNWSAADSATIFDEALTIQEHAIKRAIAIRWDSEHPWVTLFYGVSAYLSAGGRLATESRRTIEMLITETKANRWRLSPAVGDALSAVESRLLAA